MLHLIKMEIPDRERWGGTYQLDLTLPLRVKKIRGFFVNISEDDTSRFRDGKGYQVANCSISLNNTDVITASTPAISLRHLTKNTITANKVKLSEPLNIENGSIIRVIVDEILNSPFVKSSDADADNYFAANEKPTNSYTLKVYLIYDK